LGSAEGTRREWAVSTPRSTPPAVDVLTRLRDHPRRPPWGFVSPVAATMMVSAWFGLIRRCPGRSFCRVEKFHVLDRISGRLRRFGHSSNHARVFRGLQAQQVRHNSRDEMPETPTFWGRGASHILFVAGSKTTAPVPERAFQIPSHRHGGMVRSGRREIFDRH